MDFLALTRRDLQALCKRNGVRANMTNVAMAEALAALPAVDGIEEYVKVPVAVPAPEGKAAAAERQREKQGSPLPRGRRVTVKAVEADVGRVDVEEDEKRELAKEDPPALGVGRRGPSRRARPVPAVATPVVEPVGKEEEKQDGSNEEDQRSEENKEDAPAPVVGRRGASRRGRPAPAAVSAGAGAGEEREIEGTKVPRGRRVPVKSSEPIRSDDCEEEEVELKQKASTDDAPALGAGRRDPSRRARATSALPAPAGKAAEQEQMAPIPRGRHTKAKSIDEVNPVDGEADEKQGADPEEEEADVLAPGVCRRGASRRARRAPAVATPAGKVTDEVVTLDDSDTEPEEKDGDAPEIVVRRRGANTRAPVPVEAPATRRRASTRIIEAGDVAVDAVPIRPIRQRKPTMKVAAAAKEKALPKATRRDVVKNTVSQQGGQDKTKGTISDVEALPEPVSNVGCDNPEDSKEASDPQNTVQKQEDEGMVIIGDEILMKETPAQQEEQDKTQAGTISDVAVVPEPVSNMGCDNSEDSKKASDPQNRAQKQEDEGMVIEDDILLKESVDQECMDYSTLQEQQEDVENRPSLLTNQEDSPIMGLVSMADEQAPDKDEGDSFQDGEGFSEGSSDKGVFMGIYDASDIMQEAVTGCGNHESEKLMPIKQDAVTGGASHESEIRNVSELPVLPHGTEEASEANTAADLVSPEKEDINVDQLLTDLAVGSVLVDCSGNINLFAKEDTSEDNTEDYFSCQEKGDVVADTTMPDTVAEAIPSGCSSGISWVEVEKAGDIICVTLESPVQFHLTSQEKEDIYMDHLQADLAVGSILVDCSGSANLFDKEVTGVVNTEDVFSCQEKEDVDAKMALPDMVFDAIPSGCSSDISWVEVEKAGDVTSEMPESPDALDEDGGLKEVAITEEVPQSTEGDVVKEDKAGAITGEVPNSTGVMDECVQTIDFENCFLLDELNNAVTTDNMPEDGADGNTKNTLTCDLPQELKVSEESDDHITPALLADVTEHLSKNIVTVEPIVSISEATSVCNNSSEKKAAEPVAILNEKGFDGAKKSVDLYKLSLGQLRTKLKETLNAQKNKETKRVALARVDENVCRSRAKGQQQNLNLQQH
ncbi:hypothetical protein HU200_050751 [Digitaria exilis]|uniref:Uncharacterized protein n=1 Tax=Digitaria exilis TaxID=1010633 RepID=A0A835AW90_9POAL|nr:hypothetical protein HU200_050751 [Digitaria exilis]